MINWEEILNAQKDDDLKSAKLWLFQENIRLQKEKQELEQNRDKFMQERVQFQNEMNILNRKTVMERQRLREENKFFDKKMEILQQGYMQLDLDRKAFEREKKAFLEDKKNRKFDYTGNKPVNGDLMQILFRGADNPMALRKRYRDLVKIYHPDNASGDAELVQMINREFFKRKKEE